MCGILFPKAASNRWVTFREPAGATEALQQKDGVAIIRQHANDQRVATQNLHVFRLPSLLPLLALALIAETPPSSSLAEGDGD